MARVSAQRRARRVALRGIASLLRGVDTNWDLRNYHFYNPWAWLHGRLYWDYAPAQGPSYHSPLLDLPFFALVHSGMPAFAVTFLMGLPFGLTVYFLYRIARCAMNDLAIERQSFPWLAVGVVALTGAAGFSQIGSTMNEWATASLVMAALFVIVRSERGVRPPDALVSAVAGVLCGVATGLKLTAAIYAVALSCCVRRLLSRTGGLRARSADSCGGHGSRVPRCLRVLGSGTLGAISQSALSHISTACSGRSTGSRYPLRHAIPSDRRPWAGSHCRSDWPSATASRARPTCATRGSRCCACSPSSSPLPCCANRALPACGL